MEDQIFFPLSSRKRERERGRDLREQFGQEKKACIRSRFMVIVMLLMESARMVPSNSIAGINNRRKACVTGFYTAICMIYDVLYFAVELNFPCAITHTNLTSDVKSY